jgi:2-polyprenyl-6-methoxyphenol hydroxylase-like FAD-dependent oxidoreductase
MSSSIHQSTTPPDVEVEVIVVGAGPVGAALAGDLGSRGVTCILVEATDGRVFDPRLHAVNVRTMELARRWGIERDLRDCGWPKEHSQDVVYVTSIAGTELGRVRWPAIADMQPPAESPTFAQRCPQTWFNAILQEFALRQPAVQRRFLHRLEAFEQDATGVTASIRDLTTGQVWTARARYLVGCDGARSGIRDQLEIERTYASKLGHSAEIIFRSPALAAMTGPNEAGRYNVVQPTGMSKSLLPIDGRDLYRMTLIAEGSRVTQEAILAAVRESIGADIPFEPVNEVTPWISGVTSASRFNRGRVFLAGDAAHTMPTTGGMGMNTGILDAFDLSWKLHACLRGWGGPVLLESYEIERRQAADRTSEMASVIYLDWLALEPELRASGHLLYATTDEGAAYRARLGKQLVNVFSREFNSLGAALGYRYNGSPICIPDGSPEPEDSLAFYLPSSRPGHRAPHLWIEAARSTLDLFGAGFAVLQSGGADGLGDPLTAAAAAQGIPAKTYRLPAAARDLYPRHLTIVRPDGHVAWRGDRVPDARALWATLCGVASEVVTAA